MRFASSSRVLQLILVSLAAFAAQFAFGQGGTVTGTVRLTGTPPANPVIRMGADPNCLNFNAGKRVFMPNVEAGAGGALASVFVHVQGSFPGAPGGSGSVTLDQKGCMYHPVISGAQVGQTLVIRNDDSTLHNIHSLSKIYTFDQSQPRAGMTFEVPLKTEEVMLHVKCNVHPWMSGYIGIASNPYYAVTDETGKFTIKNVPAGKQTIQVWQDAYGPLTQTVDVKAGATVNVDFAYTGNEHPTASQMGPIQEITIPAEVTVASIVLTGR